MHLSGVVGFHYQKVFFFALARLSLTLDFQRIFPVKEDLQYHLNH